MSAQDQPTTPQQQGPKLYRGNAPMSEREAKYGFTRRHAAPSGLTEEQLNTLAALADNIEQEGHISGQRTDNQIRRSKVAWLRPQDGYLWLYQALWPRIVTLNDKIFGFDISGFGGAIQLARYDAGDSGFYDWHMDSGKNTPHRKLSFSVQISDPKSYEGGDLELFSSNQITPASRARGALVAFPSFVMHRVTPVTRGTRLSLVAWIVGPRWR